MTRSKILAVANQIVTMDREKEYGTPENNFELISNYWSTYLGKQITGHDVALLMCFLKIARIQTGQAKADNYIDLAGYSACAGEIALNNKEKEQSYD